MRAARNPVPSRSRGDTRYRIPSSSEEGEVAEDYSAEEDELSDDFPSTSINETETIPKPSNGREFLNGASRPSQQGSQQPPSRRAGGKRRVITDLVRPEAINNRPKRRFVIESSDSSMRRSPGSSSSRSESPLRNDGPADHPERRSKSKLEQMPLNGSGANLQSSDPASMDQRSDSTDSRHVDAPISVESDSEKVADQPLSQDNNTTMAQLDGAPSSNKNSEDGPGQTTSAKEPNIENPSRKNEAMGVVASPNARTVGVEVPARNEKMPPPTSRVPLRNTASFDRTSASDNLPGSSRPRDDLTLEEVDVFLDLIVKHNPESMTPENMTRSVEGLYGDWMALCTNRHFLRKSKKALMDEYGKIFHGRYGQGPQRRARKIAQDGAKPVQSVLRPLPRQCSDVPGSRNGSDIFETELGSEGSPRHLAAEARTKGAGSELEPGSHAVEGEGRAAIGNVGPQESQSLFKSLVASEIHPRKRGFSEDSGSEEGRRKRMEANNSGENMRGSASGIAQVGRNGLAVLPPGLFEILSAHLKDEILGSIMPLMRSDLTEQARELALQSQDLLGRLRALEDQVRAQDMLLRQLLARDQAEWLSHEHPHSAIERGTDPGFEVVAPYAHEVKHMRGDGGFRDGLGLPRSMMPRRRDSTNWRTVTPAPPPPPGAIVADGVRLRGPHSSMMRGPPRQMSPQPRGFDERPQYHYAPGPHGYSSGTRSAPPTREWVQPPGLPGPPVVESHSSHRGTLRVDGMDPASGQPGSANGSPHMSLSRPRGRTTNSDVSIKLPPLPPTAPHDGYPSAAGSDPRI